MHERDRRVCSAVTIHRVEFDFDGDDSAPPSLTVHFDVSPGAAGDVRFAAAAPAERRGSATGSLLPFANERQALDGTLNAGVAQRDGFGYTAKIRCPNSYYTSLGTKLVPPSLHVAYETGAGLRARGLAKVAEPVPFRTLAPPELLRDDAGRGFYAAGPEASAVRSQDRILLDSAYPATGFKGVVRAPPPSSAAEFWGARPPL